MNHFRNDFWSKGCHTCRREKWIPNTLLCCCCCCLMLLLLLYGYLLVMDHFRNDFWSKGCHTCRRENWIPNTPLLLLLLVVAVTAVWLSTRDESLSKWLSEQRMPHPSSLEMDYSASSFVVAAGCCEPMLIDCQMVIEPNSINSILLLFVAVVAVVAVVASILPVVIISNNPLW